jgi:hypothetical protein
MHPLPERCVNDGGVFSGQRVLGADILACPIDDGIHCGQHSDLANESVAHHSGSVGF